MQTALKAAKRLRLGSIRTRLVLTFLVLLALIAGPGLLGVRQLQSMGDVTRTMRDESLPRLLAVSEVERALMSHKLLAERHVQSTDFRQQADMLRQMRATEAQFEFQLERLRTDLLGPTSPHRIDRIESHWQDYRAALAEVDRLMEQGDLRNAGARWQGPTIAAMDAAQDELKALIAEIRAEADHLSTRVDVEYIKTRNGTLSAVALGLLATLLAVFWTTRFVSQPLLRISSAMQRLTRGEDDIEIPHLSQREDEIGILSRAAESFRGKLVETRLLAHDLNLERLRLEASSAQLQATVHNMPLGLAMFDRQGTLMICNAAFETIWNIPENWLKPDQPQNTVLAEMARLCPQEHRAQFAQTLRAGLAEEGAEARSEIWRLTDERSICGVFQPTPDGWMLICEDITERVTVEERIRKLARNDSLTGLHNRLSFQEALESALQDSDAQNPAAIMFIDLDRFKSVNDTLGHPVGDELLRRVAARLRWLVRENDVVARLGGDEFAIIQYDGPQPEAALSLGDRIIAQLSSPFEIDGHIVQIGGSVGVALAPLHGDTPEDVQKHADLALYAVKEAGKGHCRVFDPEMNTRQKELHALEQALRHALKSDGFTLNYQPLIELETGRVRGAEALLRWRHPTKGPLSPAEFVPLAEELGLIQPLGLKVLDMACQAAMRWPDDMKISVNLSPLQFHRYDVAQDVLNALDRSGLPPGRLEVEITEGVLLDHTDATLAALKRLRAHGISVALDDFGTGYSSLRYLRAFPFDRVKIDAAFVGELPRDEGAGAIVRAICNLCQEFSLSVTAEGIETEAQRVFVKGAGCSFGQGYLFAAPMPLEDFMAYLDKMRAA